MRNVIWCGVKVRTPDAPVCANQWPPITAEISSTTPKILGPVTVILPAWLLNIQIPMIRAMGTVAPIVNTPHGLFARAFTTTIPRPASVTSRIKSTAIMATRPAKGLISVRAISASDRPLADRGHQNGEILHAAGQHGANQQPQETGGKPELCGQRGPHQRARSGNGGEVVAEEHPFGRGHIIMPVSESVRRSGAAVVQHQSFGRNKRAVVTVSNRVDAESAEQNREGVHRFVNLLLMGRPTGPPRRTDQPSVRRCATLQWVRRPYRARRGFASRIRGNPWPRCERPCS